MKHVCISMIVGLGALAVSGCAGVMPGPGHALPGFLVSAMEVPGSLGGDDALYLAHPDSFVVLGWTEGSARNTNILGLFSFGNGGYRAAIDDAKAKSGADLLISCTGDVRSTSVLVFFATSKTIVRGVAVKRVE